MWKCKTCDKVNDDKLEICWGCYTPKLNSYIEDVTTLSGGLHEKENKRKAPEQFIALILINIPILLLLLTCLGLLIYFHRYIADESPIVEIFLSVSILFFSYFILLYNRKKVSITLGYIFHTIILLESIWFIEEAIHEPYILLGLYCFICSIISIVILTKMKKSL